MDKRLGFSDEAMIAEVEERIAKLLEEEYGVTDFVIMMDNTEEQEFAGVVISHTDNSDFIVGGFVNIALLFPPPYSIPQEVVTQFVNSWFEYVQAKLAEVKEEEVKENESAQIEEA